MLLRILINVLEMSLSLTQSLPKISLEISTNFTQDLPTIFKVICLKYFVLGNRK